MVNTTSLNSSKTKIPAAESKRTIIKTSGMKKVCKSESESKSESGSESEPICLGSEPLLEIDAFEDEDMPLCELAKVDVANVPVISSIQEILKQANDHILLRVFFDLKVACIKQGRAMGDKGCLVQIYCCTIKRKETKSTLAILDSILDEPYSERKSSVLRNMVRLTIWNSTVEEVERKIKLLDIIRIKRFNNLRNFNGNAQMSTSLQNIEIGSNIGTFL